MKQNKENNAIHNIGFLRVLMVLFLCITGCQNKDPQPDPELLKIKLLRGDIITCGGDEFGEVRFSLSCKPSVREAFDLAVSLLHSFEYDEAEKAFVKVMDADPDCAMAYWGVAMSIYHTLWAPPSEEEMKRAVRILYIAESIPKSEREQEYLDAIGLYYHDWETLNPKARALKMEKKMEEIYTQYPDDTEAAILYALALNSTADPTDKTYANQKKAGQILESLFPGQPNHPGIAHYIIHTYDYPALAERALITARKYAEIAPASAHAQHMPSHIFIRLGLWDESIKSNQEAKSSALCYAEAAGFEGHWDEELHCVDYLAYAYLQKGDKHKAIEQNVYLQSMQKITPVNFKVAYALAATPARIALENRDWNSAAHLELSSITIPWEQFPWQKSIVHFTRALGAAHLGDTLQSRKEIEILRSLHQNLLDKENLYEANQVLIQLKASQAWLNFAQGKHPEAIALMQESADMEDNTTKHSVTPCEVLPARELLGDMLLAMHKPAMALAAYRLDLEDHPNRFNGLYGAAIASKELGNHHEAREYFEKLMTLSGTVESTRPELLEARELLENM
ncbi:MAG TPA: hypothetical protein VI603_09335 [Saprospiraceae bacterium]|nr:hypothetical protein [Saprospiraceae bacterium]